MTISQIVGHGRSGAHAMPLHAPNAAYRFVAPRRGRALANALMLAAAVLALVAGLQSLRDPSTVHFIATGVAGTLVVVLWTVMQARVPQTVTLTNSVIEIKHDGAVDRFDLADPSVEVLARDGEMAFRSYDGRLAVVRARDVDWKEFTHVVMHYQNHADRKAIEREQRFSR